MLGRLPDDRIPKVAAENGTIGVWETEDGEDFGIAMSPLAAIQTGLRLIGLGAQESLDGGAEVDPTSIGIQEAANPTEECVARIIITLEGAKIGIVLDAQQLIDFTAELRAVSLRTT